MAALWLDDGSGTITGAGPLVSCNAEAHGDQVFHALWKGDGPISSGTHYWEIENKEGLGAVGMTTLAKFGKGYACRSFNFNALNLSDGGALLVAQYGPGDFKNGDVVGLLCEIAASALTITFYLNGRCLGPAFRVDSPYPTDLYPVLTFKHGGTSATIKKVDAAPAARSRAPEATSFPEGHWTLVGAGTFPVSVEIRQQGAGQYTASMRVVNRCNMQLRKENGQWKCSAGMTTMMLGPPEAMQLEGEHFSKFQDLTDVLERDGHLVIVCPSGELVFHADTPGLPIPHVGNVLER